MPIRLSNIRCERQRIGARATGRLARALDLRVGEIERWRILRKSLDARDKADLAFVYSVEVGVPQGEQRLWPRPRRSGSVAVELYSRAAVRNAAAG